jgi:2-keto-myo-inositol isomerase
LQADGDKDEGPAGDGQRRRPVKGQDEMLAFALNHMTVARLSFAGSWRPQPRWVPGVEVRNDLPQPLFNGPLARSGRRDGARAGPPHPRAGRGQALQRLVRDKAAEALALMRLARACGAEAVALIPRNDNGGMGNGERQANLRVALKALRPMLEDHELVGLVEPLGFEICALRHKVEAVEAIEALGATGRFRLVHDTFHHHLAHGGPCSPSTPAWSMSRAWSIRTSPWARWPIGTASSWTGPTAWATSASSPSCRPPATAAP